MKAFRTARILPITASLICALARVAGAQALKDDAIVAILKHRVESGTNKAIIAGYLDAKGKGHILSFGASDTPGLNLDGDAVFEIGSVTKTFTATILADMVLKGEIALDDPIAKYLPASVKVPSRNGRTITIIDLATHTSGLPKIPGNLTQTDPQNPYAAYSVQNMYDYISGYQLTRDPGTKFEYSNTGVGLLGHILTLRANKSYEALVTDRVLKPLKMTHTAITLSPFMKAHLVQGHDKNGKQKQPWDLPTIAGAGALRSNMHDLLLYLAAQRDTLRGPLAKQIAMTHRLLRAGPNTQVTVGLAWHREAQKNGDVVIYHSGETGGYHAYIGFNAKTRANAILLSNSTGPIDEIGSKIIDPSRVLQDDAVEPVIALSILQSYIGNYQVRSDAVFTISLKDGRLGIGLNGKNPTPLYADNETTFHIKGPNAGLVFHRSLNGQVVGLDLRTGDEYEYGPRIPDAPAKP